MTDINDVLKILRNFLLNDQQMKILLDNEDALYLIEKPEKEKLDNYIIYLYKPFEGRYLYPVQIEFRLVGKDLQKLTALKSRLIKLMNYNRDSEIIKEEDIVIKDSKLLNGGGQIFNSQSNNYELIVFFLIKF